MILHRPEYTAAGHGDAVSSLNLNLPTGRKSFRFQPVNATSVGCIFLNLCQQCIECRRNELGRDYPGSREVGDLYIESLQSQFVMPPGESNYEVLADGVKVGSFPAGQAETLGSFWTGFTTFTIVGSDVGPTKLNAVGRN